MCSTFVASFWNRTIGLLPMHINLPAYRFRQAQAEKQELPMLLPDSVS
jgi:hypothetical protein